MDEDLGLLSRDLYLCVALGDESSRKDRSVIGEWRRWRQRDTLRAMLVSSPPSTQWIELDPSALAHNATVFRTTLSPGTQLLAVVKANAYGHGLEEVSGFAEEVVDWFGVHTAAEARALRRAGVGKPILVMGVVPPTEMRDLDNGVHLLVSSSPAMEWVADYRSRCGVSLPVHLKVDTGTKRQGVAVEEIDKVVNTAVGSGIEIVGLATHFANIEDTLEHDFALQQLDRFHNAIDRVAKCLGGEPPLIHAACSAASLLFRSTDFTLARVGISLYGHWPSRETKLSWSLEHGTDRPELRPGLSWRAMVGQLQPVQRGETVGYGRTWRANRDTMLAVIPVGYADGYPRELGNRARIAVKGCDAPVVGRVCMNILMADVTDLPGISIGEPVTLIGADDGAVITVEDLAGLCGTINYEFLARLSPTIPRMIVPRSS